jgi:glycosyltransferase involved in cell wall biosynthesis
MPRLPEVGRLTFSIPYYTGVDYLERVLRSVVAQDDDHWDAVVIDDGKDDGVDKLVERVGSGRIRYEKNPHNLGIGGNFNRSLELPTTDLVTVLHNDDELEPSYGRLMRDAASRHPGAAAFFCRARIIGPDSKPRFSLADVVKSRISPLHEQEIELRGEEGVRALLKANFIVAPTLCFRMSRVGAHRFPADKKFVLDLGLTTSLLFDGETLVGVPDFAYLYRRHENNATERLSRTQHRFLEESAFYDSIAERTSELGWDACTKLAREKRIIKLNLAYRTLKSVALLQLGDAARGLRLLRQL